MSGSKKKSKLNKYILSGALRKNGIETWRYIFNGIEKYSGQEKTFFLELEMLNPFLSPMQTSLGFKSQINFSPEDLQYALAGTISATELKTEKISQPSFVTVRIGIFGQHAKHFSTYSSLNNTEVNFHPFEVITKNCRFTDNHLSGTISYSEEDIETHPEFLCNAGYAKWNLDFETIQEFTSGYNCKNSFWAPLGIRTNFSGLLNFDGTEYSVTPIKSFGYFEKSWGKSLPSPYFHISSSNSSSLISGRTLFDSSFAVHGIYNDKISLMANFEGNKIAFTADSRKSSYQCHWDCQESTQGEDSQLHWSVSVSNKIWIVDIDVFCKIKELFNKVIELPEGNRKTLSLVSSASGTGEIKLYKKTKKTLEQIENIRIAKALCEFGNVEEPEI